MKLRAMQQAFLSAIKDSNDNDFADRYLVSDQSLNANERLAIYRDSMRAALIKTLEEIYPVCKKLVGDEFFTAMLSRFIKQTPSHSPDLNDYGQGLAEFIDTFPHTQSLPYYADVARLEWAWHRALNGAAPSQIDFEQLAHVDIEQGDDIQFYLPENGYLLSSQYPINEIWRVNQDDYEGELSIDLSSGGVNLLIWRPQLEVLIEVLDDEHWFMLNLIEQGEYLSDICRLAVDKGIEVQAALPQLVARGWLSQFREKSA